MEERAAFPSSHKHTSGAGSGLRLTSPGGQFHIYHLIFNLMMSQGSMSCSQSARYPSIHLHHHTQAHRGSSTSLQTWLWHTLTEPSQSCTDCHTRRVTCTVTVSLQSPTILHLLLHTSFLSHRHPYYLWLHYSCRVPHTLSLSHTHTYTLSRTHRQPSSC